MSIKTFFSRLGLSNRQKQAEVLIDKQMDAGNFLARRIENLRGKDQSRLPRDQWVPNEEVLGCHRNGRKLIEDLFGKSSDQLTGWEKIWNEKPPSSPYDNDDADIHLNRILQVNAYFAELKGDSSLSRNAIERIRDKFARHPVLGPVVAIAGILATCFALFRGLYWFIGTFFGL